jgi:tetratricopeptide (TPR) repeat protein
MNERDIAGRKLLELVAPFVERDDRTGLAESLKQSWSPECLALLLDSPDPRVVRAAIEGLALIGHMGTASALADLLHDENADLVDTVEDALWSIWFRAGGRVGNAVLAKIAESIEASETENVVALLTELIRSQPTFAEAYHQRAQAHYLENNYEAALRDARRAVHLNPNHFSAVSVEGHSHAAMGRFSHALEAYNRVLRIHPRMYGIRAAIRRLREFLTPAAV